MNVAVFPAFLDWETFDDLSSTTASPGVDITGEETESSCFTCDELSSDEDSMGSEDLGACLLVGRWTSNSVERYRRLRVDGWENWRYFCDRERLLRITFQALVDLWEEVIRASNDEYPRTLES